LAMLDEVELARPMGNHASLKPRRRQRKGKKLQARRFAPRNDTGWRLSQTSYGKMGVAAWSGE
jgi:hypothetical protein